MKRLALFMIIFSSVSAILAVWMAAEYSMTALVSAAAVVSLGWAVALGIGGGVL